ncbi:MAG: hypothetical protein WAW31_03740 [Smithella sp.]
MTEVPEKGEKGDLKKGTKKGTDSVVFGTDIAKSSSALTLSKRIVI